MWVLMTKKEIQAYTEAARPAEKKVIRQPL